MSTNSSSTLAGPQAPLTLDQRLRRNRRTRRAARIASARHASLWIAGLAALAVILSAGEVILR